MTTLPPVFKFTKEFLALSDEKKNKMLASVAKKINEQLAGNYTITGKPKKQIVITGVKL